MKLRGVVSQGLLLPLSVIYEGVEDSKINKENVQKIASVWFEKALDLSNMSQFNVVKYDKWIPTNGRFEASGLFPWFIKKSDQERLANLKSKLPGWLDKNVEVSIKLDGSSMTVFYLDEPEKYGKTSQEDGKYFGICSRNLELRTSVASNFTTVLTEKQKKAIQALPFASAFQGELVAPNIQGNYEKVNVPEFYVYNVFDIANDRVIAPDLAKKLCDKCGLNYVPVLFTGKLSDFANSYEKIVELSEGQGMNPGVKREGIVVKSMNSDDYFSFKQISTSYLLKEK
jgi:RNA ligase (TIGR02306 family)